MPGKLQRLARVLDIFLLQDYISNLQKVRLTEGSVLCPGPRHQPTDTCHLLSTDSTKQDKKHPDIPDILLPGI